jgi:hypothetical protein
MTFHDLAEIILEEADKPLTPNEIWGKAVEKGIDQTLDSKGKNPWATLGAKLYTITRDVPGSKFKAVGQRPKRFFLANKKYNIDFTEYESGKTEEEINEIDIFKEKRSYLEKDLHAFLSYFAFLHLKCHTKTINHSKSGKKEQYDKIYSDEELTKRMKNI